MNEWASKLLSVFPDKMIRADLDQFIIELNNDQAEQMYYQKEINEEFECRPTYEQLSIDRILEEANKNLSALKALELLIQDRYTAFNAFQNNITKIRSLVDVFENNEGSLKVSVDSFCLFVEQETLKAKQQIYLSDLKRSLGEMRLDAQRRVTEYQREVITVEKELAGAEKKLAKSKEVLERSANRLESFELDSLMNPSNRHSHRLHSASFGSSQEIKLSSKEQKEKSAEYESHQKYDKELKDDIRSLLRAIANREQVLCATRRAFQKLDRECKRAMHYTLKKVLDRELESLETQKAVLENFGKAVEVVNIENDIDVFVQNYNHEEGGLVFSTQALHLLSDITPETSFQDNNRSNTASPVTVNGSFSQSSSTTSTDSNNNNNTNISATELSPVPVVVPTPSSSVSKMHRKFTFHKKRSTGSASPPPPLAPPPQPFVPPIATSPVDITKANSSYTSGSATNANSNTANAECGYYLAMIFGDDAAAEEVRKQLSDLDATINTTLNSNDSINCDPANNRHARVKHSNILSCDIKTLSVEELVEIESNPQLAFAVMWLINAIKTPKGRENFISQLNQFRSRKVDVGVGFNALSVLLWATLSTCQKENDVHTAKIIMMLSQTFYRMRPADEREQLSGKTNTHSARVCMESMQLDEDDEDEETAAARRGVLYRQFLKEKLMGHAIWQDGNFWEQALWQCAIEQLKTIPYERPWYDMDRDSRDLSVRRVHDVVFSQVMAITHSMLELGCTRLQCREFLYRMCVIHQLTESQRQQLLSHVLNRSLNGL